jgi:hypothetical protein
VKFVEEGKEERWKNMILKKMRRHREGVKMRSICE